jgi:hypothetical protein
VAFVGSWVGFYVITPLPYLALETFRATVILHAVTGLVLVPYLVSLIARRRCLAVARRRAGRGAVGVP